MVKKIAAYFIIFISLSLSGQSLSLSPSVRVLGNREKDIQMTQVDIDIKIIGSLAVTTYEIRLYNPNTMQMEGEFQFPLTEGQSISRFALDINGSMREGVVVDKTKGQEVFESIARRRVDPGLLEKTKGNNFRARVRPQKKCIHLYNTTQFLL